MALEKEKPEQRERAEGPEAPTGQGQERGADRPPHGYLSVDSRDCWAFVRTFAALK